MDFNYRPRAKKRRKGRSLNNKRLTSDFGHNEGVDVMIAIFCHFRQFSAKKIGFLLKNNDTMEFLHYLALFEPKMSISFANFF
jgi:hypothetical protein